jgi:hypothetical protein
MRITPLALAITCVACSSTSPAPPESIAGRWSSWAPNQQPDPAGPMILILTESGTTVSGTASQFATTYRISGQYRRPSITLNLVPDIGGQSQPGQTVTDVGVAVNGDRLDLAGTVFYRSQ